MGGAHNGSIINSTIFDNVNDMGVMLQSGTYKIINSIISGNESTQLRILNTGNLTVEYCEIDGGQDSVLVEGDAVLNWGSGNIDVHPAFVDTANGNYHLLASSQLINAGHPDSTDSDGTRADMGAYPYLNNYSGPDWFVSESGNDTTATGSSDNPFRSIQAALNFGNDDDIAYVSAGPDNENLI